jgi:hypothetical protein
MEFRVGGHEVLLSLDKAYVAEDDTALLQQVSRFKPLVDYLTTFKPADLTLSTLVISNVNLIAGRVAGIRGHITLKHKTTKATRTEPLALSDEHRCVVLPVLSVGDRYYAVLVRRPRLAIGGEFITEAFEGTFAKEDGAFVAEDDVLLQGIGLQVTEKTCSALAGEDINMGVEGSAPVKVLRASKVYTEQSFDEMNKTLMVSEDGRSSLVIIPVEDVPSHSVDLKAIVAASLFLRSKA